MSETGAAPDVEEPVACTLGSAELRHQAGRWQAVVERAGIARTETPDGLSLSFRDEPAVAAELQALVGIENGCCAWATWTVARRHGELVLHAASTGDGIA